jgi:NAD(P)H-hydrate epimerase
VSDDAHADVPSLPKRDASGHKGTFGTVAVIGGQAGATPMIGGPALSAIAALRAGAGLVRLLMPAPILANGLVIAPSATGMALPTDAQNELIPHSCAEVFDRALDSSECIAIGPGLGVSAGAESLALRAVNQNDVPVVVDADAINNLARVPDVRRDFRASAVLTPHPGEFDRIASSLGVTGDARNDAARPIAAERLAQSLGCIVVLKGAHTVVSDGIQTWRHDVSDAALATAGTGDVLTGLLASLIAQFGSRMDRPGGGSLTLFQCAQIAVIAHTEAARLWRTTHGASAGLLAVELAAQIPAALESLR